MKRTSSAVVPFRTPVVFWVVIPLFVFDPTVRADVKLPAIFRDYMVLQRNAPIKV
ncbi:hypothetical protein KK062_04045 [Fulvivirgaceae bacterium PWU5]|uniref:Uncharacterized protein n=1 Tax=Dawidia cretensis TaxID=2782350 RepID=A0AAP2DWF3_9BACT|nr:hypothetical protein [Dawidia cretensis]MBT1707377.1 hypothetical protein [Dawidia cretensis]